MFFSSHRFTGHIAASDGQWQSLGLNGRALDEAGVDNALQNRWCEVQIGESDLGQMGRGHIILGCALEKI